MQMAVDISRFLDAENFANGKISFPSEYFRVDSTVVIVVVVVVEYVAFFLQSRVRWKKEPHILHSQRLESIRGVALLYFETIRD